MAKKSRTPPPPKRSVQAPKQRVQARTPEEKRTLRYLMLFSASGIVILGAVLAFVAFGGGGGGGSGTKAVTGSKSCVEKSYPGLAPKHLSSADQKVKYNSFPPSSGPHYQTPAPWDIYPEPVQQTILVHNLEHGGIIVQYGKVDGKTLDKIRSFYQDDPNGLVVAPNPALGSKIALTAWNEPQYRQEGAFKDVKPGNGYVLMCTVFDGKAFAKFRDVHRNKAGERFPKVTDMAPNTQ